MSETRVQRIVDHVEVHRRAVQKEIAKLDVIDDVPLWRWSEVLNQRNSYRAVLNFIEGLLLFINDEGGKT